MKSDFIAYDKEEDNVKWIQNFLEDIPSWPKPVPTIMSIVIVSQQLEWHKLVCIMVSPDIYVINIIPLNTYSKMESFPLTM